MTFTRPNLPDDWNQRSAILSYYFAVINSSIDGQWNSSLQCHSSCENSDNPQRVPLFLTSQKLFLTSREATYHCKIVRQNGQPLVSVIGQMWSCKGHSSIIFQRIFTGMAANFIWKSEEKSHIKVWRESFAVLSQSSGKRGTIFLGHPVHVFLNKKRFKSITLRVIMSCLQPGYEKHHHW